MDGDVQPDEPGAQLLAVATAAIPGWLRRVTASACERGGVPVEDLADELDAMVEATAAELIERLAHLLATDVDEQRTTPLSLCRDAIAAPTKFLQEHGVRPTAPASAAGERFRDDAYAMAPASWADIDPTIHEPGLAWGAWKAMTILRRRRDEGLR